MSYALIGALVGLAFAAVEYIMFAALIAKAERRGEEGQGSRVLDFVRKAQLILFPAIGFFAGPMLIEIFGAS